MNVCVKIDVLRNRASISSVHFFQRPNISPLALTLFASVLYVPPDSSSAG